jgi:membrane-bound lytic murein transglycosylase B
MEWLPQAPGLSHPITGEWLITPPQLRKPRIFIVVFCLLATFAHCSTAAPSTDFQTWLDGVRQEALARGVSQPILDAALRDFEPIPKVLELDQRQPEFVDTFLNYLNRRVTPERVEEGRELLRTHGKLLSRISKKYDVPAHVLVAFWGLETHYGGFLGLHPVPAALATLAYDPRRSGFFRAQLLDALDILQAGHISPEAMKGSWAGAMGQLQFMPSTFQAYAVDGDGDGRKDLWNSLPDAFASAANYLHQLGWHGGEIWGREVCLPRDFDWDLANPNIRKSVTAWRKLGVTRAGGERLPRADMSGAILLPQGHAGPAFLVYRNFDAILTWNRAINYALAVGHLADRLIGQPGLQTGGDADNRPIPREEAQAMQRQLIQFGFDLGEADGVLGSRTKAAIRGYQRQAGLPVDGYPSMDLLERLRQSLASVAMPASGQPQAGGTRTP